MPSHTDYIRWSNSGKLEGWWEARTAALARFVPNEGRIIEFGAGRCRLPHYLKPGCTYFASDIVPRTADTIICDLNRRPLPDFSHLSLDVAVFAGVLEYVGDLPEVVRWLATQVTTCVVSYDAVDPPRWTTNRLLELSRRRKFGYMNDYGPAQFVRVFEAQGFECAQKDLWESQELYRFEKMRPGGRGDRG
jgi:hypothetical protein